MPTVEKERILKLAKNDHQKYLEITNFFLDFSIPKSVKELKSFHFLENELSNMSEKDCEFPNHIDQLEQWVTKQNKAQCIFYGEYIGRRSKGGKREYFSTTSKAYEFLYKIAPTKRVDGAWLYSFIQYWDDPAFRDFIQIYLEELGLGNEENNHVKLYDNLLFSLGLHQFSMNLSDEYYHQSAIQLALAYASSDFIPEIAGFNLGYEQLPLHLLITNYELKELGIDSNYFNQHITIDNFENGHAHLSINAVKKIAKNYKDQAEFMSKLKIGFLLNNSGVSSVQIIKSLNTKQTVIDIFKKKAVVGKHMHSNKCMFKNKATNEWLSDEDQIEDFICELINIGWIKLNQDPEHSRFWKIINDDNGKMFGVFSVVEKAFIYDWIAGSEAMHHNKSVDAELISNFLKLKTFSYSVNNELQDLQKQVNTSVNTAHKVSKLMQYLAPHMHHQEIGLWSTQRFVEFLFPFLSNRRIN
ncbi:iron-containing redox enzyme family protein [Acinetobacter sp. AS167]|uniref:iron-containing redox enzyme family protein n=1 Tax=Acinetobacter sp. AS167 TaxID=3127884 RepID=UPI003016BC7C